jgi:HSP20 family protein
LYGIGRRRRSQIDSFQEATMRPNLHPNAYVNPYGMLFRNLNDVTDVMHRVLQSDTRPTGEALQSLGETSTAADAAPATPVERTVKLPVDAWTSEDAYFVTAFVPGVNPEDVEIVFEEDELTIRGRFPAVAPEGLPENAEMVKRELFHGAFERTLTFRLPVNADAIEAHYHQGLLSLRVPKAESVKPRQIRVTAK